MENEIKKGEINLASQSKTRSTLLKVKAFICCFDISGIRVVREKEHSWFLYCL